MGLIRKRRWLRQTKEAGSRSPTVLSLKAFYADESRSSSETISFGEHWRDGAPGDWTVEWVCDTGELVAFYNPPPEGAAAGAVLFEILGSYVSAAVPEVAMLMVERDLQRLDRTLDGWEQQVLSKNGMDWLWSRVGATPDEQPPVP
jgi:hypothetical protein